MDTTPTIFVAEAFSKIPWRLYLSQTGIEKSSFGSLSWLGWEMESCKLSPTGEETGYTNHWEDTLLEILRYEEDYSDEPLNWRCESSGEIVDLRALQPKFDASRRFESAVATAVAPGFGQRLCFNLYDDGLYRFTLEELIREEGLEAWVPRSWSKGQAELAAAKDAARSEFDWFK